MCGSPGSLDPVFGPRENYYIQLVPNNGSCTYADAGIFLSLTNGSFRLHTLVCRQTSKQEMFAERACAFSALTFRPLPYDATPNLTYQPAMFNVATCVAPGRDPWHISFKAARKDFHFNVTISLTRLPECIF